MAASFPSPSQNNNKWYFTREQIENSPSRQAGLDPDKELSYRQQAANLLQDMGQRLNVYLFPHKRRRSPGSLTPVRAARASGPRSQLTINTAIVYMHRFYMVQSFTRFHRNVIAPAALFLAAKVEEQPRKLEHVIKVTHACLNPQDPSPDTRSDTYLQQAQDLVILESIILQTLGKFGKESMGFEITIDHPHTHVVKCTQLVRGENQLLTVNCASHCSVKASKDLAQTLHLTTFCLQYSPPIVACVCIHLACKWSNWEIPVSTDSKHWWQYVDPTVTLELLDDSKAAGQTGKKSKVQDGDPSDAIMSMISMSSSDSTLAGLMSLSGPPSGSSMEDERNPPGSSQHWQGPSKEPPTANELHAPAKVSLSEYRAKHADELAAQKRKLENMEANVKQGYATAAQALMNQQRREKHHHHQQSSSSDPSNQSSMLLKIPQEERAERSGIKMRLPVPGQSGHSSSRGSDQDIKVRIRVPDRRSGSGEDGKSREKHRERSNHHHHRQHHHHSSTTSSLASSSSAQKHSGSAATSGSTKKSSGESLRMSSSSTSRKRSHLPDPSHSSKVSKSSRNSFQLPTIPGVSLPLGADILPSLNLSHHQGHFSHGKVDKADTNGHNSSGQSSEYQDTFDMLNSLLSAQGVQPTQPQMFDYRSQYRYSGGSRGGGQPPPLPSEPPPPLPPLPK
ncbi:hypothetical protein DNTS_014084 [Danionella cerebrum]|uniref:Cyclin-like domain-containing protein n=1 Tax=Danionella cerebrum TaxID=2873325 RepID=A0A553QF32_9TELE|nr:hypothetical protein DNTS_014084 [Danionella translucida]